MERRTRAGSESGFTLAALIVLMTIMMIIVAYTVPRQWSTVVQRERELETIFIMKQYARAIHEFSRKNGNAYPVSMEQLTKSKLPRYLRGVDPQVPDPLTGEVDWQIIPAAAAGATGTSIPGTGGGLPGSTTTTGTTATTPNTQTTSTTSTSTTGTSQQQTTSTPPTIPAVPMKDYAGGPFIGIRPGKTGKSFLEFNGAQNYEQWSYTVVDYRNELNVRLAAAAKVWQ